MFVGIGIALTNWLSVALLLAGTIVAYSYRVKVEERALLSEIGEPYAEYMRTHKRFIPFVV
jgi:protein-S-isoprenylcysteine O-methyltransferase Ste14